MLIRFSIENFLSFKSRSELLLIPGKVRRHSSHVIKSNNINLLKTSIIYGPNASGKSNIIKAISYAENFILNSAKIDGKIECFKPFKLDGNNPSSRFEFEIKVDDNNYAYGFIVNSTSVIEEWLYKFDKNKEECIFNRNLKMKNMSIVLIICIQKMKKITSL